MPKGPRARHSHNDTKQVPAPKVKIPKAGDKQKPLGYVPRKWVQPSFAIRGFK
jgi:hypothetical protein